MFAKKFRKFFKPVNGNFRDRDSKVLVKPRGKVRGNPRKIIETSQRDKFTSERKCHECGGRGHI
jgi:hypothetical protein